jgi:hypothetical protein
LFGRYVEEELKLTQNFSLMITEEGLYI